MEKKDETMNKKTKEKRRNQTLTPPPIPVIKSHFYACAPFLQIFFSNLSVREYKMLHEQRINRSVSPKLVVVRSLFPQLNNNKKDMSTFSYGP